MNGITIQNKLMVYPGNQILVPGCEPLSEFTSLTLAQNLQCNNSYVKLEDVLTAIPQATVVTTNLPGTLAPVGTTGRYLVLPDGPPSKYGCTDCSITDWYQIIKNIPREAAASNDKAKCDAFSWSGCAFDNIFKG